MLNKKSKNPGIVTIKQIQGGARCAQLGKHSKRRDTSGSAVPNQARRSVWLLRKRQSPISLFKICGFQETLSELLRIDVDVAEYPLTAGSDLRLDRTVRVYGS